MHRLVVKRRVDAASSSSWRTRHGFVDLDDVLDVDVIAFLIGSENVRAVCELFVVDSGDLSASRDKFIRFSN